MFFTEEDYRKIEKWLSHRAIKDTQFTMADTLTGKELVPLVQDNKNKLVKLYNLVKQLTNIDPVDFYNISDKLKKVKISLKEAINLIPLAQRKLGLVITFEDEKGQWNIYQFRGYSLQQWSTVNYWENIITDTLKRYIDDNLYFPDEEDITGFRDGNRTFIKFKDRHPSEEEFISVGTVILRRNIQGADECNPDGEGTPVNILTQDMINEKDVIYVIQYDFDLDGKTISVPEGSTLWFQGGTLHNGNLYLHDTAILGAYKFEDMGSDLTLLGTFKKGQIMTFHNDAYKAKNGKFFIESTRESSDGVMDDSEVFYDINPDAYITTDRQELRWWNGEEWIWILDAVDYNELRSIINDLIEKHNIEIANLYKYVKNKFSDIYNEINDIKNEISEIWVKIGDIEAKIEIINGEIAKIKVKISNIETEIQNIHNDITNINNKIEEIENTINNITNEISNIWNEINEIGDTINEINTNIDNLYNIGGLLDIKDNGFEYKPILPDEIYVKPTPPPDPVDPDPGSDNPDSPVDKGTCVYPKATANITNNSSVVSRVDVRSVDGTFDVTWGLYRQPGEAENGVFKPYDDPAELIETDVDTVSTTAGTGYVEGESCKPSSKVHLDSSNSYREYWSVISTVCTSASIGLFVCYDSEGNVVGQPNYSFTEDSFDENGVVYATIS